MMRASFDVLVTRLAESQTTISERELLESSHWNLGEDARLREDLRFRESPWGRWMLAEDLVANDAVYRWLHTERRSLVPLDAALKHASDLFNRRCVFCAADPRFALRLNEVRLAANELTRQPVIEDEVSDLEKYTTHLPLHSLKAVAASEPLGQWGPRAQEQAIETLGWMRVKLPGKRLNDRMFVAAMEGHSMDNGKSGLVDGGYAAFELWPSGTKQDSDVLVRGAFRDPETGSYAVKRYVADERDAEGRHHKISLVSLNPDKERYPDIELVPEDDEAVTVVAKVVQALSAEDYERRPRQTRRTGRRNLSGREGLEELATRLGHRIASFFDGVAPDDEDLAVTLDSGWQTRLVCFDAAAGGLQLEVGPLDGLPPFVKKLRVAGSGDWDGIALATNARTRPVRVPVRPGMGPWRWEAVGFEEEQDLGVEKLALEAIDQSAPMVFRVDADGVGQPVKTTTLALGQAYRVLLPPNIGDASIGDEIDSGANGFWRIWSIDLSAPPSRTTRQTLTSLGLNIGEASPRLEWALTPPASWRTNTRGEGYPVLEVGAEVLVNVSGFSVEEGETVMLFLHGPTGTERLSLSASGIISLGKLPAGRWACAVMHSRTSVQPTTLVFEMVENALEYVAAPSSVTMLDGTLAITAPPGWPVALRWRVLHEELLATVYADDDGTVRLEDVTARITARARRTRIADIVVDFGEFGCRVLVHDGGASLQQVCEQLTVLWQRQSGLVQSCKGAWLQLRKPWFEPVTELFGYGLEDSPLLADAEAPHDLTAWGLTVDERVMGSITRSLSRVLVLTTDIDAVLRDHRTWIDRACSAAKVRDAIITDGARWTTRRKGSHQLKQQVWSFDHAIATATIDEMLGDLAEGL